ncbi:hypothetical protein DITRI_Ditri03aG0179400 [Diplodiscus trichospermus]
MSRRPVNPSRRYGEAGGGTSLFSHSKSRSPPFLSIVLIGALLIVAYFHSGSGLYIFLCDRFWTGGIKEPVTRVQGDFSSTFEVQRAIPILKKKKKLMLGVWSHKTLRTDSNCKGLVRNGIGSVSDIKFPLPYRPKSFPIVIVSDALDYLTPRYLNKTLPDFARVSANGVRKAKAAEVSKYGREAKLRSLSWWARYFVQTSLEENEVAS